MGSMKKLLIPMAALLCLSFLCGCYTQLASRHTDSIASRPRGGSCESGDCYDVAPSSDRREICVWERDFLGFPEMRCYNTNYYSSWVYFHNTPWWYRDRYGWRDTRGCPPYYYYDRIAGICRHHSSASGGGSGGGSSSGQEHIVERRNSRGLNPTQTPSTESGSSTSSPMFIGGGTRPLSPVGSSVTPSTSTSTSTTTSSSTSSSQSQAKQNVELPSTPTSSLQSQVNQKVESLKTKPEQTSSPPSTPSTSPSTPPQQQEQPQSAPIRRNTRGL